MLRANNEEKNTLHISIGRKFYHQKCDSGGLMAFSIELSLSNSHIGSTSSHTNVFRYNILRIFTDNNIKLNI